MALKYHLVRERCRVGVGPEGKASLEIVYALNGRHPQGTRQKLVPALEKALAAHNLQLLALDLFDEFVRLHLPLNASARIVEASLATLVRDLEALEMPMRVPAEAEVHLQQYLKESSR